MRHGQKLVVVLFGGILVVAGVAVRTLFSARAEAGERQVVASRALMFSEELVWTLEGECLKDAERVLSEPNAKKIPTQTEGEGVENSARKVETRLREYLRVRRGANIWKLAERAFITMTPASRDATNKAAVASGLRPVDILAEWMTCEGATDLYLMTKVHADRAALRQQVGPIVDTFFAEGSPAPAADKGVKVISRTDDKIVVDLFGGKVIEEWVQGKAEVIGDDKVKLTWKSNYSFLREVAKGGKPGETMDDTLVKSDEGYGVEYQDIIAEFLKGADKQHWATTLCTKGVGALGDLLANAKGGDEKEEPKKEEHKKE